MDITLLILTLAPPILIVLYFVKSDKFPEPNKIIYLTFFLGILTIIPVAILNNIFIFSVHTNVEDFLLNTYKAGPIEESFKFLVLYLFVLKRKEFNEPMDGLVYGTCASLGFATWENMEYIYFPFIEAPFGPYFLVFLRMFTTIPMHAVCGIIMGFYFGLYVFRKKQNFLLYSLAVPIIFHSLFNFFTVRNPVICILILFIGIIYALKLFKKLVSMQKNKKTEAEKKLI